MLNKTIYFLILSIILLFIGCGQKAETISSDKPVLMYRAPRVLIITAGDKDGTGTISKGVVVTLEALNKLGARVILDNRSILYRPEELSQYTHLYAPTLYGYNDADRKFSLTYLDSLALNNIVHWVAAGGILVAAENFGRNENDGTDRIALHEILTKDNWPLSKLFGYSFEEINLDSSVFELDSLNAIALAWSRDRRTFTVDRPGWLLTPVDTDSNRQQENWAYWNEHGIRRPAAILNHYEKGWAIYISLSLILHPVADGGLSTNQEILEFWRGILQLHDNQVNTPIIGINPWPGEYQSALAITLNSSGNEKSLSTALDSLLDCGGHVTLFLHGHVDEKIMSMLSNIPRVEIASGGYDVDIFPNAGFESIREDLYKAKQAYGNKARGFRFPHLRRSYEAMQLLNNQDYLYESSLVVSASENNSGSFIPYNIPIYKQSEELFATNVLELSPLELDDWAFYGKGLMGGNYSPVQQIKDAEMYGEYLGHTLNENIIPVNGAMVTLGYPDYVGYSQHTLRPLLEFVRNAKSSGLIWLANLTEIADFWQERSKLDVDISWDGQIAYCSILNNKHLNQQVISLKVIAPEGFRLSKAFGKDKTDYQFMANLDGSYLVKISSQNIQLKFDK
jgi:hypothetical protein